LWTQNVFLSILDCLRALALRVVLQVHTILIIGLIDKE
jgi:hypothetical protein